MLEKSCGLGAPVPHAGRLQRQPRSPTTGWGEEPKGSNKGKSAARRDESRRAAHIACESERADPPEGRGASTSQSIHPLAMTPRSDWSGSPRGKPSSAGSRFEIWPSAGSGGRGHLAAVPNAPRGPWFWGFESTIEEEPPAGGPGEPSRLGVAATSPLTRGVRRGGHPRVFSVRTAPSAWKSRWVGTGGSRVYCRASVLVRRR